MGVKTMARYEKGYINSRIKYHGRKGADISNKFAFVGLGLMGNRVVDTISQFENDSGKVFYPTLAINTNQQDLDSIENCKNKLLLEGFEKGAGRNPQMGHRAIAKNEEKVRRAFVNISDDMDMTFIVAGLGGGTGTGGVLNFVNWAIQIREHTGIQFGLMLSIPRDNDGNLENRNALTILNQIKELVAKRQVPLILIDNEMLYKDYLRRREQGKLNNDVDWTSDSNLTISGVIHQLNLITKFKPTGNKNFDAQELLRVLNTGGCVTFSRMKIPTEDFKDERTLMTRIENGIEKGLVSEGYDYKNEVVSMGVSIISPINKTHEVFDIVVLDKIERSVSKLVPNADIFWGTYEDKVENTNYTYIFTVMAGMNFPQRVDKMHEKAQNQKQSVNITKDLSLDYKEEVTEKISVIVNPFEEVSETKVDNFSLGGIFSEEKREEIVAPDWLKDML